MRATIKAAAAEKIVDCVIARFLVFLHTRLICHVTAICKFGGLFTARPFSKMSDYDFSSSLSGYGAGASTASNSAQKRQVMEQVKNQVAVANAQELLQVSK